MHGVVGVGFASMCLLHILRSLCVSLFLFFFCVCVRYNYILNNWLQSNLEKLEINAMAVSLSVAIITNPGGPRYAQRV